MALMPGVCVVCQAAAWRSARHAKTGEPTPLWPDPLSTYATCETPIGHAPGIPYCRTCAPILGASLPLPVTLQIEGAQIVLGAIIDLVPAPVRYGAWYEQRFREWLAAWLRDHLELSDTDAAPILAQWEQDARAVKGLFDGRPADASRN